MGSLETWGTAAAIVLLLECAVGMFLVLVVAFGLWKGSAWAVNHVGQGFAWLDDRVRRVRDLLVHYQAQAATPFVKAHALLAGLRAAVQAVRGRPDGEDPPAAPPHPTAQS